MKSSTVIYDDIKFTMRWRQMEEGNPASVEVLAYLVDGDEMPKGEFFDIRRRAMRRQGVVTDSKLLW